MQVEVIGADIAEDDEDKSIVSVEFVRHDSTTMDLQIQFSNPTAISVDILFADELMLTFV